MESTRSKKEGQASSNMEKSQRSDVNRSGKIYNEFKKFDQDQVKWRGLVFDLYLESG